MSARCIPKNPRIDLVNYINTLWMRAAAAGLSVIGLASCSGEVAAASGGGASPVSRRVVPSGAAPASVAAASVAPSKFVSLTQDPAEAARKAQAAVRDNIIEPIPPYLIGLNRRTATICWVTASECVGELHLFSYSDERVIKEEGPPSHYHKISIDGLEPSSTYRYEIGRNYVGSFATATRSASFEVAVFGHPGGTERPLEYPTELLAGRLEQLSPEFVLCTGDITFRATIRNMRDCFLHRFGGFMSKKPIYISPANHEGRWNGHVYTDFRKLFPYKFGPKTGGSHWFDYKHARFFALTYKLTTKELFEEHVRWLADAIDNSDQDFNIVFLGGQEPKYYDKDLLFRTLKDRPVELVLGGDGGSTFQERHHGIDLYFSGDGGMGPFPFYYLRFFEHHFEVQGLWSESSRKPKNLRGFYSKRPRRIVQPLDDKRVESEPHKVHCSGIATSSLEFAGVQFDLNWPHAQDVELQLYWRGKKLPNTKEQCHLVKAKSKSRVLIHIPSLHPSLTPGVPYELQQLTIQLAEHRKYAKEFAIQNLVSNISLFAH